MTSPLLHAQRRNLVLLIVACLIVLPGCSLMVMAGKVFLGDPKVKSPFSSATGQDLTEVETPVAIICEAPHRLISRVPSLQIDILDRVARHLETQGVRVVDPGDLASWYDDHGEWGDFSEMAEHFDAGHVLKIELREFSYQVPESENLLQGRAEGHLTVVKVNTPSKSLLTAESSAKSDNWLPMTTVFDRDFSLKFPTSYPIARETQSEDIFAQTFIDRVAVHISQHLYDYKTSESVH